MNYLIRTVSAGIVMVEAENYLKAVGKLRQVGIVGIDLVGAFQPYKRDVTQLTLVGDNLLVSGDKLKAAINDLRRIDTEYAAYNEAGFESYKDEAEILKHAFDQVKSTIKDLTGIEL